MDPPYLVSLSTLSPVSGPWEAKNDPFPFQNHRGSAFKIALHSQVRATKLMTNGSSRNSLGNFWQLK